MMLFTTRAYPLYNFLHFCEKTGLERSILDCGAGGHTPPLSLFFQNRYECTGIDISSEQVREARVFAKEQAMTLNISQGDMRELPFKDNEFSFAYSFNTIFHLTKKDILSALQQLTRVTVRGGLIYINLLSIDDPEKGNGKDMGNNQFIQHEYSGEVIHSYFKDSEFDLMLKEGTIVHKEKRGIYSRKNTLSGCFLDYIIKN